MLHIKEEKLHSSLSAWNKAIAQALENVKDLKPMPHVTGESEFNALAEKASLLLDQKLFTEILLPGKSIEEKNEID